MWTLGRWVLACCVALTVSVAQAADGQAELDQATTLKVTAESLDELAEVINLCQRALDKGLDADATLFAKQLLASTLTQRGMAITAAIFAPERPDARWQQMRRLALADLERSLRAEPKHPRHIWRLRNSAPCPGVTPIKCFSRSTMPCDWPPTMSTRASKP